MTEREKGRQYGIKQACKFVIKILDQPTIAEDIEKYLLNRKRGIPTTQEIIYGD